MKSRRMRWTRYISHMGEMRNSYEIFIGKPEGKRLCRRHGRRWENNITIDLREIGWEVVDCICLGIETNGGLL
jgi:hypothetical protein